MTSWLIEIEKNSSKDVYKLLIGNKNDLEERRQITYEEGKEFASINGMEFFETSAKTAYKVQEAFESLTKDIIRIVSKDKNLIKFYSILLCSNQNPLLSIAILNGLVAYTV